MPDFRGVRRGLDTLMQVLAQAEEKKRRDKYDVNQDLLFQQSQTDRTQSLADAATARTRDAEEYDFLQGERHGSADIAAGQEELAGRLAPKMGVMGNSPFRGPTASGPGGEVGVMREPEPEADPIMAAISTATRPGLRNVNGVMRDPSTSRRAQDDAADLRKFQLQTSTQRATAEHAASLRPPPVTPRPSYQRIEGPDGTVRFFDPETGKTVDSGQKERIPSVAAGSSAVDNRQALTTARNAKRDLGLATAKVQAARTPALSTDEYKDQYGIGINMAKLSADQRRKTADSTIAEVDFTNKGDADREAQERLQVMGLAGDEPPESAKPEAFKPNATAQAEVLEVIEEFKRKVAERPEQQQNYARQLQEFIADIHARYGIK